MHYSDNYRTLAVPAAQSGLGGAHNLREYRAIALDVGDQDDLRTDTAKLHEALDKYSIRNTLEVYSGTHTSAVADRFRNHVLPFFSANLCERPGCRVTAH